MLQWYVLLRFLFLHWRFTDATPSFLPVLREDLARIVRTFGDKLLAFKFPPRTAEAPRIPTLLTDRWAAPGLAVLCIVVVMLHLWHSPSMNNVFNVPTDACCLLKQFGASRGGR